MLSNIALQLQRLYRLDFEHDVSDFVVARSEVDAPLDRPEQVLLRQTDDAVELALVLEDALLEPDVHWNLDRFCSVAEGVSHLLYLFRVAENEGQVTKLELEVQAEIDKWVLLLFGGMAGADALRRLFDGFTLREDVQCPEEQDRYAFANQTAQRYCSWLQTRYVEPARTDSLLSELRKVYRMFGARKLGYVSGCRR